MRFLPLFFGSVLHICLSKKVNVGVHHHHHYGEDGVHHKHLKPSISGEPSVENKDGVIDDVNGPAPVVEGKLPNKGALADGQYIPHDPAAATVIDSSTIGSPSIEPRGDHDTPLKSIHSIYYIGTVIIGGQPFYVIFDTGSNLLWVPGSECTDYACSSKNKYTGLFESLNRPFSLTYGSGPVKGQMVTADVVFADGTLNGFKLGLAHDIGFPGFSDGAYEGLLGLAWPALNDDTSVKSVIPELFETGQIPANLFAIYMSADGTTGELSIGEIDENRYSGTISWMPLVLREWWTVNYVGFSLNEQGGANSTGLHAIIDSGTSLIVGPQREMMNIIDGIAGVMPRGVMYDSVNQVYAVKCADVDYLPNVDFLLKGSDDMIYQFTLPGRSYVVKALSGDSAMCPLAFQPDPSSDLVILGDVFLRAFYTVYDYGNERVGLASCNPPAGLVMAFGKAATTCVQTTAFWISISTILFLSMFG